MLEIAAAYVEISVKCSNGSKIMLYYYYYFNQSPMNRVFRLSKIKLDQIQNNGDEYRINGTCVLKCGRIALNNYTISSHTSGHRSNEMNL